MEQGHQPPFGLRMQPDLKYLVKAAAVCEGCSMNAQIVQHLRTIYKPDGDSLPGRKMTDLQKNLYRAMTRFDPIETAALTMTVRAIAKLKIKAAIVWYENNFFDRHSAYTSEKPSKALTRAT